MEVTLLLGPSEKPTQEKIDKVKWIACEYINLKNEIEIGIYNYYKKWMKLYDEGMYETFVDEIPIISKSVDIWDNLENPTIFIENNFGQILLSLAFDPVWDSEYHVYVYFSDDKIDRIDNELG